ncbi:MAG TPA: hypothetical protein VLX92_10405 [Kofleriaceae bacterium]|nr:hypothetical protein [Kofleriaceae bacterium]
MRRTFCLILVLAVACGGAQKPSTPPPPLPADAKPEPATPPPQAKADTKPEPPPEPPKPTGPIETTMPAAKVTVKLVAPGKGKRQALKLTAKPGSKQQVELAMDFSGKQSAPAELGGVQEQVAPTVVLVGDAEVQDVDKDGAAKFQLTVTGVDAKDQPGTKTPAAEFKADLVTLNGMTIAGTTAANGTTGDLTLHIEKPDDKSDNAVQMVKLSLLPMWPVLPTEPVGVGAKWQVASVQKIADRLEVTNTVDWEVVAHKGNTWTLKGTSKLTGADQNIDGAQFGSIAGNGTIDATLVDGAFVPATKISQTTDFTATAKTPDKTVSLQFHLLQGNAVTPKP